MQTKKKVTKQTIKQYFPLLLVISLILFLVVLKIQFETAKQTIVLNVPKAKTTIYMDGKKEALTTKQNEKIVLFPEIGEHSIIATKDDSWPWQKNFQIQKGENFTASVFNTKKSPVYSLIPEYVMEDKTGIQNNTYKKISALFDNIQTKQISYNKLVSIELSSDNKNIFASWLKDENSIPYFFCKESICEKEFFVLPTPQPIRQISFYPLKDDRIIFSSGKTIWIIELDRNKTQNAQPLYAGVAPEFIQGPGDNLYVKDSNKMMLINL